MFLHVLVCLKEKNNYLAEKSIFLEAQNKSKSVHKFKWLSKFFRLLSNKLIYNSTF